MKSSKKIKLGQIEKGEYLERADEFAIDSEVVHRTGDLNEEIDGVKTFKEAPKSQKEASTDQELVRYKEHATDLASKANDNIVVKTIGDQPDIDGVKGFLKSPQSEEPASVEKDLVRKKEFDSGLSGKADSGDIKNSTITIKKGTEVIGSFTLNQDTNQDIDLASYIPEIVDVLTSTATDKALSANQGKILKGLIDDLGSSVSSGLNLIGGFDANAETSFPSNATKGDTWVVEVSGTVQGEDLETGDMFIARVDSPSTTNANDWIFIQRNIDKATENKAGYIQLATQTEVDAGQDDEKAVTPKKLNDTLGVLARKDTVGTAEIDDGSVTAVKLADDYVEVEAGKSLVDNDEIAKLANIEEGAQKNVQADYAELDAELDSFIKNKESYLPISDEFDFSEGETQRFALSNDLHRLISVEVNGQGLVRSQWNEWHNMIEILDELDDEDSIRITYMTPTDYSRIHGFRFDETVAAPEVERIGNLDMATELPIQKGMKGCLLLDNGKENYLLEADDWSLKEDLTPSDLSGADGMVMVRVPRHWYKDTVQGNIRTVLQSDKPFEGGIEVKGHVASYKASKDRTNNMLASVMNNTAQFRGGNNQSAWDNDSEYKSQLGKPVTNHSRTEFRELANNRGENWHNVDMVLHTAVAWLITYEFGTRNHQQVISEGPTNLSNTLWDNYNSRNPLFKCGLTNSLGNGTGEITLDISAENLGASTVSVFRYRGIENWWGDIYEWMSGVNIIENKYYMTTGKLESDTNAEGYKYIGDSPTANGYIQKMHPGTLLPATNNGSSSTYYADYLYANDTASIMGLLRSAYAVSGAYAGSFIVSSAEAPSLAVSIIGSRLCFSKR